MPSTDTPATVVKIGVFAAQDGWLLTHPSVQSRFVDREDAIAAARRLAHLESWRGHVVDMMVQERVTSELRTFQP